MESQVIKQAFSSYHPIPVGMCIQYCPVKVIHNYSKEYYYILSLNKMSRILVNYRIHGYLNFSIYLWLYITEICIY